LAIRECDKIIEKGGYLAFHEPIVKPRLLAEGGLRGLLARNQHSKHDSEIDDVRVLDELTKKDFQVLHKNYEKSLFRVLANSLLEHFKLETNRGLVELVIAADLVVLKTICKIARQFGPSAVVLVAKKSSN